MKRILLILLLALTLTTFAQAQEVRLIAFDFVGSEFALAPTGTLAAVYQNAVMLMNEVEDADLSIHLIDVATGEEVGSLAGDTDFVVDAVFTSDASQLVTMHLNGDLLVWDVAGQTLIKEIETTLLGGGRIKLVAGDEQLMLYNSSVPGRFMLWNLETGTISKLLGSHFDTFQDFQDNATTFPNSMDHAYTVFDVAGNTLAGATQNDAVNVWNLTTWEMRPLKEAAEQKGLLSLRSIAFAPDGTRLYVANPREGHIHIYDVATLEESGVIDAPAELLTLSPDGQTVVWLERTEDRTTVVKQANVDSLEAELIAELPLQYSPIGSVAFTADGQHVVVGSLRGEVDQIAVIDLG